MTVIMFVGFSFGASLSGFLSAYLTTLGRQSVYRWWPSSSRASRAPGFRTSGIHPVPCRPSNTDRSSLKSFNASTHAARFPAAPFSLLRRSKEQVLTVRHLLRQGRAFGYTADLDDLFREPPRHLSARELAASGVHDAGLSVSMSAVVTSMLHFGGVFVWIAVTPVLARHSCLTIMLPPYNPGGRLGSLSSARSA